MTKIKFEIEIDTASEPVNVFAPQLKALNALIVSVSGEEAAPVEVKTPAEGKPKKKRRTKAEIEADNSLGKLVEQSNQEDVEALADQMEETADQGVKIDDVRKALGVVIQTKGDSARDKAASKLKEYEAKNVSTLDPKHYQDFIDYLNSL